MPVPQHQDCTAALFACGSHPDHRAAILVRRLGELGAGATVRHYGTGRVELRDAAGRMVATYGADALRVLVEDETLVEAGRWPSDVPALDRTDFALQLDRHPLSAAPPATPAPTAPAPKPAPTRRPTMNRTVTLPAMGEIVNPSDVYRQAGLLDKTDSRRKRLCGAVTAHGHGAGRRWTVDAALVAALSAEGYTVEHDIEPGGDGQAAPADAGLIEAVGEAFVKAVTEGVETPPAVDTPALGAIDEPDDDELPDLTAADVHAPAGLAAEPTSQSVAARLDAAGVTAETLARVEGALGVDLVEVTRDSVDDASPPEGGGTETPDATARRLGGGMTRAAGHLRQMQATIERARRTLDTLLLVAEELAGDELPAQVVDQAGYAEADLLDAEALLQDALDELR